MNKIWLFSNVLSLAMIIMTIVLKILGLFPYGWIIVAMPLLVVTIVVLITGIMGALIPGFAYATQIATEKVILVSEMFNVLNVGSILVWLPLIILRIKEYILAPWYIVYLPLLIHFFGYLFFFYYKSFKALAEEKKI